ncbi:tripartite tricarboxylate transporter substrate binding protein [Siccirubricoccus sp. G192]|nr:tripartite tricarboxylate transporter substrate binding protein [Siccirubricoccus sp. G192]
MLARRGLPATVAALAAAVAGAARAEPRLASLFLFIPANPGGGWDALGRAIEQVARPAGLVGRVQFENLAGAGGTVGLPRFVATRRGRADSLIVAGTAMVGASLINRSPLGPQDLPPVARLTGEAGVVVVPADSPFRDIGQLAAALRTDPGSVAVAGAGGGTLDHIILGLMLRALGRRAAEARFVAFPGGGPSQAAVLGSQVQAAISGWGEFAEQVRSGRVRALATTGERRLDPAVPSLREAGIDVVATNWRGVLAAPGIRPEARAALAALMTELHALPAWRTLLAERGWDDAFLTGADFEAFLERDRAQTATVLKELGLA